MFTNSLEPRREEHSTVQQYTERLVSIIRQRVKRGEIFLGDGGPILILKHSCAGFAMALIECISRRAHFRFFEHSQHPNCASPVLRTQS